MTAPTLEAANKMNELLQTGEHIQTVISGQACEVGQFLGGGGQGEVYRAKWVGGQYALKWYFPHTATVDQQAALERLVKHHRAPSDQFLWPLDLAKSRRAPGFGYIMKLREPRYKSLFDLVTRRVDPTFGALSTAALQLVDSFRKLHADGLCYRDISFGNAFFDPKTGDVLICDNDNVAENRSKVSGVLGTPDFMAPELVRMEKGALPSRQTDLYSLAVLLFYMFLNSHPLMGARMLKIRAWDYPARRKIFGQEPLFIFDPHDPSNAAVPRAQDPSAEAGANALELWPLYPRFFQELFKKAFTTGLHDAEHGRVTEGEWKFALARLQDCLLTSCPCRRENFFDAEELDGDAQYQKKCWNCGKVPPLPFRLHLGKLVIVLNTDTKLFAHHQEDHSDLAATSPLAEVARHPSNPNIFGLRNLSAGRWVATTADGVMKDVDPGKSIVLAKGTTIAFGRLTGELHR
jgi:eukaryotic-like serine/threonine-protein kinase